MKAFPLVSVIILNWNGMKLIEKCLDSVFLSDYFNIEVIVSDNGSVDRSNELIKKKYPRVTLIENKRNLGFCEGNNVGIECSKGEIVILLNNDTIVDKDWIKEIVGIAENPKVGIIGCVLYSADTSIVETSGFGAHASGRNIFSHIKESRCSSQAFDDVDYVSGAALAVKRSVLDQIGLLIPFFFAYGEDMDLCFRAREVGYRVVIAYDA